MWTRPVWQLLRLWGYSLSLKGKTLLPICNQICLNLCMLSINSQWYRNGPWRCDIFWHWNKGKLCQNLQPNGATNENIVVCFSAPIKTYNSAWYWVCQTCSTYGGVRYSIFPFLTAKEERYCNHQGYKNVMTAQLNREIKIFQGKPLSLSNIVPAVNHIWYEMFE